MTIRRSARMAGTAALILLLTMLTPVAGAAPLRTSTDRVRSAAPLASQLRSDPRAARGAWATVDTADRLETSPPGISIFTNTIDNPIGIAVGPDGALWFTNAGGDSIGRITTAGTVTTYTRPGINDPDGIAAGPDGALWFTNAGGDSIGRISACQP